MITRDQVLPREPYMHVGGSWVRAVDDRRYASFDPSTGQLNANLPWATECDVDRAVDSAHDAFQSVAWRGISPLERAKILWRVADLLDRDRTELAYLESVENGMPVSSTKSHDLPYAADILRYMASLAMRLDGEALEPIRRAPGKILARVVREPVGVVAAIVPWNVPLIMSALKLGPALAAGNTVVLKPAPETSLTALKLAELFKEAGLPPGVLNVITGKADTGARLVSHPKVNKVTFTGSTSVGKEIVRSASIELKTLSLELGGKTPNIICSDVDLPDVAATMVRAAFGRQGQSCTAGSRMLIEESVFDEFLDIFKRETLKLIVGDALDEATEIGPLISREHRDRVHSYVVEAQNDGADVLCGGEAPLDNPYFYPPTIIVGTSQEMEIEQAEVFGPVVTLNSFKTDEEALARANGTVFGLAASVWSGNSRRIDYFCRNLEAGMVWVNAWSIWDPALPFGGMKQSGWGRENGTAVLEHFTRRKTISQGV